MIQDSEKNTETTDDIEVQIEFIEGKIENYSTEPSIAYESKEFQSIDECKTVDLQDELELWEPVEIPDIPTKIADEQVKEEFMLEEEEIEFQGIDEYKIVQLQEEQEIEECVVSEPVEIPDISITVIEEQEIEEYKRRKCIKEISDMTLPEMCNTKVKIHKNEIKLEMPIIKDTRRM